jgi:CelD/BcsL family acetyltransferase involved in cellulose biosynthesis
MSMHDYSLALSQDDWDSPEIRRAWEGLIARSASAGALEKCPEFLDHLLSTNDPSQFHLATLRDGTGSIVGVVPLRVKRSGLEVSLSGRVLWESRAQAVSFLGGVPLLPTDPVAHDLIFDAIERELPAYPAIAMRGVPLDSFLWRYLHTSDYLKDKFILYPVNGVRHCHTIPLPATVGDYRARLSGKKRYNLRRQVRVLNDLCGGRLKLLRVESPQQVGDFVEAINATERFAGLTQWGRLGLLTVDRSETEGLAGRGLLLNYILMCDDRPCAALMGMQYRGVYYLSAIPRDRTLDRFSPGSTAFHMAIEDLIRDTPIVSIDLGFGKPAYLYSTTNVVEPRASLLLLRRTPGNRIRRRVHAASRLIIDFAKRCFERSSPRT